MRVNEDAEVRALRFQVEDLKAKLTAARMALEQGCSLTPKQRDEVIELIRS